MYSLVNFLFFYVKDTTGLRRDRTAATRRLAESVIGKNRSKGKNERTELAEETKTHTVKS